MPAATMFRTAANYGVFLEIQAYNISFWYFDCSQIRHLRIERIREGLLLVRATIFKPCRDLKILAGLFTPLINRQIENLQAPLHGTA
jgi:hypothetical protein